MTTLDALLVPWHQPGDTSIGRLTIAPGDLTLPNGAHDPSRIKVLVEHERRTVYGHLASITETDRGLEASLWLDDETPGADEVIRSAQTGRRDAVSIGADYDHATRQRIKAQPGAGVRGVGVLREVSLVAVPAWHASRITNVHTDQ